MVILGKTTKLDGGKQGYKFNSYVKSDRAAVATHIKVKDSEEFLLIASVKNVKDVSTGALVSPKSMEAGKKYVCTIKNSSGENKEVEVSTELYIKLAYMTKAEEGKGEYLRTEDGRYVKKDEIQPPAYKTREIDNKLWMSTEGGDGDPTDKVFVETLIGEYVTLPSEGELIRRDGSRIELNGERIDLPSDKVSQRDDKWYYKESDDADEIEVTHHLQTEKRIIGKNSVSFSGSVSNNVAGTYSTNINGENVTLAESRLDMEVPFVEGGSLSQKEEKLFSPSSIDSNGNLVNNMSVGDYDTRMERARKTYTKLRPTTNDVRSIDDYYKQHWVKITYIDGRVKVYYTGKKPTVTEPGVEFTKVRSYKVEPITSGPEAGRIKFDYELFTADVAQDVEVEDGEVTSYKINGLAITDIVWDGGLISQYKVEDEDKDIVIKDIEWELSNGMYHIKKCILLEGGVEKSISNIETTDYAKYAVFYRLTNEIKNIVCDGNTISEFTVGSYKFTNIRWNSNFEIISCDINGETIHNFKSNKKFGKLRFHLTNLIKVQGLKLAHSAAMFTRDEEGNYQLNADLVQTNPEDRSKVEALTSVGQGVHEMERFKRNPFATTYVDDQGKVFSVSDFKTTYNESEEFTYEIQDKGAINKILGKHEIKYEKCNKPIVNAVRKLRGEPPIEYDIKVVPSKAEDYLSWGLLQGGVALCNSIIGIPFGVMMIGGAAVAKTVGIAVRAVKKQQIKHESLEKVTERMQNDVKKQCEKEINALVKDYADKIKRAKKECSAAELEEMSQGLKEEFTTKYLKIAGKLQLLGNGQLASSFDAGKKGKITAENYLGYLACTHQREAMLQGKEDHPDLEARLKAIDKEYKDKKKATPAHADEFEKDRVRAKVKAMQELGGREMQESAYNLKIKNWELYAKRPVVGLSTQQREALKRETIRQIEEERDAARNSWGSAKDRVAHLKTTTPYKLASRKEQRAMVRSLREEQKKAYAGAKVETVGLQARVDKNGHGLADEFGRDAISYMHQTTFKLFTSHDTGVAKFEYGCHRKLSPSDSETYHADRSFGESMVAMSSHTCDNSVTNKLVEDYNAGSARITALETQVNSAKIHSKISEMEAAKEEIKSKGYVFGLQALAQMHTSPKLIEAKEQADTLASMVDSASSELGALHGAKILTLQTNLSDATARADDIIQETEDETNECREAYDARVEEKAMRAFIKAHKEEYESYVASRREIAKTMSRAAADDIMDPTALREGFIEISMKGKNKAKNKEEFESIRWDNDEVAQIEALVLSDMEEETFNKFKLAHPEVEDEDMLKMFYIAAKQKGMVDAVRAKEGYKQNFFNGVVQHFKSKTAEASAGSVEDMDSDDELSA